MEATAIETIGAAPALAAFACDLAELSAAADYLAKRIIDRRGTVPELAGIHIAADLQGVTLTATDLDIWASVRLTSARVEAPGAMVIDGPPLAAALAKARKGKPGAECRLELQEPMEWNGKPAPALVALVLGRNRFKLKTLPLADFPTPTGGIEPTLSAFTMPAARFLADLATLALCAESKAEDRFYLQGVAIEAREMAGRDCLVMVATDGHVMGIASRPAPTGAMGLPDSILPNGAIAALAHAGKLAGTEGDILADLGSIGQHVAWRFALGPISLACRVIDGTFPQWERPWLEQLAADAEQPALFPDLLPGAPTAAMDRIAKAARTAIEWQQARAGMIGAAPEDPGLAFAAYRNADGECGKRGFCYASEHGTGEITGPDGVAYPVAFSDKAIHLSAAQVRALIGESCFETMEATRADGRTVHILRWLWEDGASRFLTVAPNGRTWVQGELVTRAELEAVMAGEIAPVPEPIAIASPDGAGEAIEPAMAPEGLSEPEALSGPEIGSSELPGNSGELPARETLAERWAREDAFIGPRLPKASGYYVDSAYPGVLASCGRWYVRKPGTCGAMGPFDDLLQARQADAAARAEFEAAPEVAAPVDIQVNGEPDPIAELAERVAALEASLATLSAVSTGEATEIVTPTALARPKRTPAHERAIRRAWAERKARRRAEWHNRIGVEQLDAMRESFERQREARNAADDANSEFRREAARARMAVENMEKRLDAMRADLDQAKAERQTAVDAVHAAWRRDISQANAKRARAVLNARRRVQRARMLRVIATERANDAEVWGDRQHDLRKVGAQRARRMVAQARKSATFQRQRADVVHAQLAKLRADMADPMQPERASDLSRLIAERDEARNAAAATDARNRALQAATDRLVEQFEALAVRVAKAEAALRAKAA